MTELHWQFRGENTDGGRDFGNANVWAFDPTLAVFTREVCQNVLDVREGSTVHVDFGLHLLRGNALLDFQERIRWDELYPHLLASADDSQKFGRELKLGLQHLDEQHELVVLSIQELNAKGLLGAERGTKSNFAALCRNNLDSNKSSTAGGAFGLGKAVLWRCSALSTVLFHSDLVEPLAGDSAQQRGRLFGRCELAWHATGGEHFAGPGWFGRLDEHKQAVSAWNQGAEAADMLLDRPEGSTGTSILVLGFQDPSREGLETVESMARDLAEAVCVHFWPAIVDGSLAPTVGFWAVGPLGERTDVPLDLGRHVGPFVDMAEKFRDEDLRAEIAEPGGVVHRTASLDVPARLDGEHAQIAHDADLLVRRADPEKEADHLNSVALVRGLGMVVEYWKLPNLRIGARPFHAVLRCGEAAHEQALRREVEEFLRSTEPPSHDTWTLTPDVKATYRRGGGARLDDLRAAVRGVLRELVAPVSSDAEDGPEALKRMLTISAPSSASGEPHVTTVGGGVGGGTWRIEVTVTAKPRKGHAWRFVPVAKVAGETGSMRVDVQEVTDPKWCTMGEKTLTMDAGRRQCTFALTLDPLSLPGDPEDVALDVSLSDVEAVVS